MIKQHFFIEGRFYGTAERVKEFACADLVIPQSYWFLCPVCGDAWAKVVTDTPKKGRWSPIMYSCRKCGGLGSIARPLDEGYTEALPLPVLLWEFERELERYDKEYENEYSKK